MLLVSLEKYMQILILSSYLGCVSVIITVKILYLKIDILTEIFFVSIHEYNDFPKTNFQICNFWYSKFFMIANCEKMISRKECYWESFI